MKYEVIAEDTGKALFATEDKEAAFARAREFDARPEYTDSIYIEDEDGRVYEDLTEF